MTVLTEEMVFARTKTNNLKVISKLNCWGSQLSNVSILRKMTDVTVLSLSVNNIETLEDIQFCAKLQELFVRKNNIKDLNEVCYLKELVHLKHLWLGDNPCADEDGYRLAVIKTLPRLEKLDGVLIEEAEFDKARRVGRSLTLDPSDEREYYSEPEEESYGQESAEEDETVITAVPPVTNNHHQQQTPFQQYYRDREDDRDRNHELENGHYEINQHTIIKQEPLENDTNHRMHVSQSQNNVYDERGDPPSQKNSNYNSIPRSRTQPNVHADGDYAYSTAEWKRRNCALNVGSTCCIQPHIKRPNERRTNVLNAVLCLVKELDFPNLEVVQMAVKCRMEELANEPV